MRDKLTAADRAFQRLIDERAALQRALAVATEEHAAADLRGRIEILTEVINQRLRDAAKEQKP